MSKGRKKHAKTIGNYAKPPLHDAPSAFVTYPLTSYPRNAEGVTDLNIGDQDVLRLREFDIENKK